MQLKKRLNPNMHWTYVYTRYINSLSLSGAHVPSFHPRPNFGWLISPAKNRIPLLVSSFVFRLHHILRICPRNLTSFTRRFLSRSRGAILSNTHYGSHSLASWLWIPSQIFLVKVVFFFFILQGWATYATFVWE